MLYRAVAAVLLLFSCAASAFHPVVQPLHTHRLPRSRMPTQIKSPLLPSDASPTAVALRLLPPQAEWMQALADNLAGPVHVPPALAAVVVGIAAATANERSKPKDIGKELAMVKRETIRLQTEIRALSQLQTRLQEKRLELVLQQHRDQEQALMRRRLEKENEA